ncbi:MAG: ATP-binding protein [Cryomorphaceae bacterium]|nr:ATP-binding protein [Cryomorphaceae bacterium]
MIQRQILSILEKNLTRQKVTLLLGARRVGKTALLRKLYLQHESNALWLNAEDAITENMLEERSVANYKRLIGDKTLLIIDEAHFIPDIARKAKLMIDNIEPLHVILTGSSAFELEQNAAPLAGRTFTLHMHPLAQSEWQSTENAIQTKENLPDRLVYGSYPELSAISDLREKVFYLNELVNTYLLKDILIFEQIRNAQVMKDLLVLLAYQIGNEVSVNELGRQLGMSKNTVERYLGLFEKAFIIFPLSGYSNNLRKEVRKSKKYYFWDNGIRNALINDFSLSTTRSDIGALWEQYFIQERRKFKDYRLEVYQQHFWRTYDQQEIDLVEIENRQLQAFECKWKPHKSRVPKAFSKAYPQASFTEVNPNNYLDLIME